MLTFITLSSQATLLSFDLNDSNYQVGDMLTANIVISEIESDDVGFDKLVASFDTNVLFDDSFLAFSGISFGDKLDVDPDPFFASFQNAGLVSTGNVFIQEIAQAFDFDLYFAQSGLAEFVLATVNFTVLKSGESQLEFDNVVIGDALAASFTDVQTANETFKVANNVSVPEPSTFILLLVGMLALLNRRTS